MSVTLEQVATALGRATPVMESVEAKQWELWISDAAMLIAARKERVNPSLVLDPDVVDYVVREAVAAHVRRPDDATTVNVSVDDASVSKTFKSSSGRVSINDEWWALLGLAESGKAFGVDTLGISSSAHWPWCSVSFGAYCSCGSDIAGRPIYEEGIGLDPL